jgi:N-acetyl sugar amidotransferase
MGKNKKVFWCKNCLNMSTRPRITFDKRGWCSACNWMEEKKTLDWSKREIQLIELLKDNKSKNGGYDCIVPVSGGKDGSYVSHQLKTKYGINPLAVTIRPVLEIDLGEENLKSFINSGFDHIHITPNAEILTKLNKYGFIDKGFPYYGWLIAVHTAVLRVASNFGVNLIIYGEDGELEYGGSIETKHLLTYDSSYQKKIYLEEGYEKTLAKIKAESSKLYFFQFPEIDSLKKIKLTHWSYFESWDPYRNYVVAKEFCGLKEKEFTNSGTFTNFSQNDQALYSLHTYMMYLKFGFGRATQDAGIEIRRGAMDRDQAINLVNLYENSYPEEFVNIYLNYFEMTIEEFEGTIDKWANKDLFQKINDRWAPKFVVGEPFTI